MIQLRQVQQLQGHEQQRGRAAAGIITGIAVKSYSIRTEPGDGSSTLGFAVWYWEGEIGPAVVDALSRIESAKTVSWE